MTAFEGVPMRLPAGAAVLLASLLLASPAMRGGEPFGGGRRR
ncbi:MAG: hypothetical protein ABI592_06495 [Acidobacteriota bacterium]